MLAFVPAAVRTWQLPHFWVKSCSPRSRSASSWRSQPVNAPRAATHAAAPISSPAFFLLRARIGPGILYVASLRPAPALGRASGPGEAWDKLEPNGTSGGRAATSEEG